MNEQFVVPSLGNCRIQSPLPLSTSSQEDNFRFVEDSQRILYQATFNDLNQHELFGGDSPISFEAAGPRAMTFLIHQRSEQALLLVEGYALESTM